MHLRDMAARCTRWCPRSRNAEWFGGETYRGCAFINSVVEVGGTLPQALEISRRHKRDMTAAIRALMPASRTAKADAQALARAVDGAIVAAQFSDSPADALKTLARVVSRGQHND